MGCFASGGTRTNDLPARVHGIGDAEGAAEGAEIDHPGLLSPQEGMDSSVAGHQTPPDDLAAAVQCQSNAFGAAEGAEIDHPARLRPRKGTACVLGRETQPDDLAVVVDRRNLAVSAAEGAEVDGNEEYPAGRPGAFRDRREEHREHHHEHNLSRSRDAKDSAHDGLLCSGTPCRTIPTRKIPEECHSSAKSLPRREVCVLEMLLRGRTGQLELTVSSMCMGLHNRPDAVRRA